LKERHMSTPTSNTTEQIAALTPSSTQASPARWGALAAASSGLFMLYVDLFIVNVALPAIGRDFHTPVATTAWTVTGYVLMIGILPLGIGRLGDLWGHRAVYLVGLVVFITASLACGFAPSIGALIGFRILQGIGAATMTPGTLAIVTNAFPVEQRGLALGVYGGISALGLIAGPLLGGLLVNTGSWRWVFFINAPIGIIAIALTYRFVAPTRGDDQAPHVDWLGLALLSLGLSGLLLAVTHSALDGWTLFFAVAGISLLALFGAIEGRVAAPLMDLGLLRNPGFVGAASSFFLFSAALFGSQPYTSLFLQNTWGFTPLEGGLAFLPAVGLIALLTPLSGILGQRAGRHVASVAAIGAAVLGWAFLGFVFILTPQSGYATTFLPFFVLRGIGITIFTTCAQLTILAATPASQVGLASGTLGMARNVGTALGVALLGGVYAQSLQGALPPTVSAVVSAQANQFLPGDPASGSTASAITHSFLALNVVAAILCGLAALALLVARWKSSEGRNVSQ
jgi:EmrB/QacA subfamily drug resistance transporter